MIVLAFLLIMGTVMEFDSIHLPSTGAVTRIVDVGPILPPGVARSPKSRT